MDFSDIGIGIGMNLRLGIGIWYRYEFWVSVFNIGIGLNFGLWHWYRYGASDQASKQDRVIAVEILPANLTCCFDSPANYCVHTTTSHVSCNTSTCRCQASQETKARI